MDPTLRLFRVIVPVGNIEAAAAFYGALFDDAGFRVSPGRHYFDCGGVVLALYDANADGDVATNSSNLGHMYFAARDLSAQFARAEALGGLSEELGDGDLPMGRIAKRPWGEVSFYMHDPWGNPLCFVESQSAFLGPLSS